jgi:hypothetical protein
MIAIPPYPAVIPMARFRKDPSSSRSSYPIKINILHSSHMKRAPSDNAEVSPISVCANFYNRVSSGGGQGYRVVCCGDCVRGLSTQRGST